MTQDEVIEMARQAGVDKWWDSGNEQREVLQKHLVVFAKLVEEKATEEANASLRQAIAGLESQEPLAWMKPDVLCDRACMYLCTKGFTQFPECANVPPQLEQNFCPRCGKRTNDIHTCTPPQDNT